MAFSRRGLFGFLAGAPVAVASAKAQPPDLPKLEPYVGQIRLAHSHYETVPKMRYVEWGGDPGGPYGRISSQQVYAETIAILRHEQWDGEKWVPLEALKIVDERG